jgi:hypothetical protein
MPTSASRPVVPVLDRRDVVAAIERFERVRAPFPEFISRYLDGSSGAAWARVWFDLLG